MTSVAPDRDQRSEPDPCTRQAWSDYSERLRELTGEEYERAESESWLKLQTELRRIQQEQETLADRAA